MAIVSSQVFSSFYILWKTMAKLYNMSYGSYQHYFECYGYT